MPGNIGSASSTHQASDISSLLKGVEISPLSSSIKEKLVWAGVTIHKLTLTQAENLILHGKSLRHVNASASVHGALSDFLVTCKNPRIAHEIELLMSNCMPSKTVDIARANKKTVATFEPKVGADSLPKKCEVVHATGVGAANRSYVFLVDGKAAIAGGEYFIQVSPNGTKYVKFNPQIGQDAGRTSVGTDSLIRMFIFGAMQVAKEHDIQRVLLQRSPYSPEVMLGSGLCAVSQADTEQMLAVEADGEWESRVAQASADINTPGLDYWGNVNSVLPRLEEHLLQSWTKGSN